MVKRYIKDEENSDNVCFIVEDSPKATYMDQFNSQVAHQFKQSQPANEPK